MNGPQNPTEERFYYNYTVEDGIIYRKRGENKYLVIPSGKLAQVIKAYHKGEEAVHPGVAEKTRKRPTGIGSS